MTTLTGPSAAASPLAQPSRRRGSPEEEEPPSTLWSRHLKVYPKAVKGKFRRLKWIAVTVLLAIYYLLPWVRWDRGPGAPDQAVLVDLDGHRLYFFFIELWPQEIYYLTGTLILAAVGLFLVTTLFGRLWCGYACPQTVWTDLFMWIERKIEGDRGQRIRLDKGPLTLGKAGKKAAKHGLWLLIAVATGGAWVFYFYDAPTLTMDIVHGQVSSTAVWFIALFTTTTYLLGGLAREQVCIYMCPWPRFQAAMQDEDSQIVTYQAWRGEGRAPLRKTVSWTERAARGLGDCIDCHACHHVCPTGIDIRDGQQLACIGCGLCVDACNDVMARIGRPGGLITFDTENNQVARAEGRVPERTRLARPRTIVYGLILVTVASVMLVALAVRPRLEVTVLHDRAPLFVTLADGGIRNGYTLKISNKTRETRDYRVTIAGFPAAHLSLGGSANEPVPEMRLTSAPDSVATHRLFVTAPRTAVTGESMPLEFEVRSLADGETVLHETMFRGPAAP